MSKLADIFPKLKDEYLEIAVNDEYEELVFSDNVKKVNTVIYGKALELAGDFLIVDSFYLGKDGQFLDGNIVYINTWSIKVITKLKSNGSLNDVLLSSSHSRKIKEFLGFNE